jgi:hypothetical protein
MYMKTNCFFAIATAMGLSLAAHAQQPGLEQERPKDLPAPPVSRPDAPPDAPRRDADRGPGPQSPARPDMQRHHEHAASSPDRDAHIREALRHLREAGLGDVAQRLEHAIGERRLGDDRRDGRGSRQDVAEGRRGTPPGPAAGSDARRPEAQQQQQQQGHHRHHPHWAEQGRREGGNTFASPQRIPNPRLDSARRPEGGRDANNPSVEELRGQVQRLTREVEALRNTLKQRTPEGPREQIRRPEELKREERRPDGPRGDERRSDAPRPDARRDEPPTPPRDGTPSPQPEGRRND